MRQPDREIGAAGARKSDEDLANEFHQGQQASDLREQAGHNTATLLSTDVKKSLELQEASLRRGAWPATCDGDCIIGFEHIQAESSL